ncbi:hypothetical protein OG730_15480 [Streptomyces sp. NBC_01298]|uniref:hypothetical protein n=1 Tax=Streptomyces sp. NBC_01298 TaxID=2903817 RepID=UPI002E13ED3B|nr:hypothetical protein OG730_15480 [Streptomyces sp. NBC_01298]
MCWPTAASETVRRREATGRPSGICSRTASGAFAVLTLLAVSGALLAVVLDLVRACRRHGLPLIAVRPETSFAAVTEHVLRRLHRRDPGSLAGLTALVERHRRLLADRAAPDSVLELLRRTLGLDVRVLSATDARSPEPGRRCAPRPLPHWPPATSPPAGRARGPPITSRSAAAPTPSSRERRPGPPNWATGCSSSRPTPRCGRPPTGS